MDEILDKIFAQSIFVKHNVMFTEIEIDGCVILLNDRSGGAIKYPNGATRTLTKPEVKAIKYRLENTPHYEE